MPTNLERERFVWPGKHSLHDGPAIYPMLINYKFEITEFRLELDLGNGRGEREIVIYSWNKINTLTCSTL